MRAKCATVDELERIRATRVEVARLSTLRYREKLTNEQQGIVKTKITELVATLPEADRTSWSDDQVDKAGSELDWSILENTQVEDALDYAVRRVVKKYGRSKLSATEDDLTQAGRMLLAERANKARSELAKCYPYLKRWLRQRLERHVEYEHRNASINAMQDCRDGDVNGSRVWTEKPFQRDTGMTVTAPESRRSLNVRTRNSERYSERHVAVLLPVALQGIDMALWGIDPDLPAYRKSGDQRPGDMPAMLADMRRSWRLARMTSSMRRAVYIRRVLDLPQQKGAAALGLTQRTLSNHHRAGMRALLDHLNGREP